MTDRTPVAGRLSVTATVDDLAENDKLPVGVEDLDELIGIAQHIASWGVELRDIVVEWPAARLTDADAPEDAARVAGDLANALDALHRLAWGE